MIFYQLFHVFQIRSNGTRKKYQSEEERRAADTARERAARACISPRKKEERRYADAARKRAARACISPRKTEERRAWCSPVPCSLKDLPGELVVELDVTGMDPPWLLQQDTTQGLCLNLPSTMLTTLEVT